MPTLCSVGGYTLFPFSLCFPGLPFVHCVRGLENDFLPRLGRGGGEGWNAETNVLLLCNHERRTASEMRRELERIGRWLLPLALGAFTLYWVYRDFDFGRAFDVLVNRTQWGWMLFSLLFGISGQVFRGLRWRQALEPLGHTPSRARCTYAIFASYAASLIIPRLGEVSRCGLLQRSDNVPFTASLGTVVTERLVDAACILVLTAVVFLCNFSFFIDFLTQTGLKIPSWIHLFTTVWFYIVLAFGVGVLLLLYRLRRMLFFYERLKGMVVHLGQGIGSLRNVKRKGCYWLYTLGIWLSYFLHFYFTFYCFDFTSHLGMGAAWVMFVGGTFAVLVPTPNGAGPWHFVIISMLMMYGLSALDAAAFALIVHGIQTLLVVLLGVVGLAVLNRRGRQG